MTPEQKEDNIQSCALSLCVDYPVLVRETAERAVRVCFDAPDEKWIAWSDHPPAKSDAPILGRDCLGYIHKATHVIGSVDDMFADHWMKVRI